MRVKHAIFSIVTIQFLLNCQVGPLAAGEADDLMVIAARYGYVGSTLTKTEWRVSRAHLAKQPKWDGFSDKVPLATEQACTIALKEVKRRFPEVDAWMVDNVALRNLLKGGVGKNTTPFPNVWYYEIEFTPQNDTVRRRMEKEVGDQPLTQVILLDGTVAPSKSIQGEQPGVTIERSDKK